jgi:hypothetical protein
MNTNQARATRGGQAGVNGEWYEGGKFLPTTEKPKGKKTRGTGRQEIEPYVWVAAEGRQSLYRQFAGLFGMVRDGVAILKTIDQSLAYYRTTREQAQNMIDRYNVGERWL